uniref:Uncharacterized protein n=1 Tax=Hyaloperonospora arabidopsidis (strain Emoy2) TaxID=559515 RepID=M4C0K4_HYAAE
MDSTPPCINTLDIKSTSTRGSSRCRWCSKSAICGRVQVERSIWSTAPTR